MKRKEKVRARLLAAQTDLALVRIDRGGVLDVIDGYVLGVGVEWLLLAVLDHGIVLDGHTCLRVRDVKHVGRRHVGDMVQQALALRGQWPPTLPTAALDLDDASGLLSSLTGEPLVTVHAEHDDATICFIGAPVGLGERSLRLLEITPRAVWHDRPTKHRVEDLTRVDVGGRYEEALLNVAGPPPL